MALRTKLVLAAGLLLVTAQSLYPPRCSPDQPRNRVRRACVFSDYFYFSYYSKSPLKGASEGTYLINSAPAVMDWARYVTELVMTGSLTGVACLVVSRKKRESHS